MIQPNTWQFLQQLKVHNSRDWLLANKNQYEAVKESFYAFVNDVIQQLAVIDETLIGIDAKQCVFRLNRDVRFSKDKSPYKTNLGASISKGGKKAIQAGYYIHIEPNASFAAAGLYMPMANELNKVRQEIDYCFKEFKAIVTNKKLLQVTNGLDTEHQLSRPPKGYDANHDAIDYLKLKSFIIVAPLTNEDLMQKNAAQELVKKFALMKPLVYFINRSLEN